MSEGKNGLIGALRKAIRNEISGIHTAAPGKVISYDPATGLASVQPSLKLKVPDSRLVDFPVIVGVPVVWPTAAGGAASVTLPLKPGDGVLIVWAERSLDDWLLGGESDDPRKFDLTDAIAIPGCNPQGPVAGAAHPDDVCMAYKGTSLRVCADGKVRIEGGDLIVEGISFLQHVHPESIGTQTGPPE